MDIEIWDMPIQRQHAATEILKCNEDTEPYGLMLTPTQAIELAELRSELLSSLGRVELGSGVVDKIILAFCTSPYISSLTYAETIGELVECFYQCKNETFERIGDDQLITRMRTLFDDVCRGSMELLRDRELPAIADKLRRGEPIDEKEGLQE